MLIYGKGRQTRKSSYMRVYGYNFIDLKEDD